MNRETDKKLLEKYSEGLATQEEMDLLVNQNDSFNDVSAAWFKYLKIQRVKSPENINSQVWSAIQSQERRKIRRIKQFLLAAACIAVLISVFIFSPSLRNQKEMSYEEKVLVLEEALSLIQETTENSGRRIIYEDEIISIYVE